MVRSLSISAADGPGAVSATALQELRVERSSMASVMAFLYSEMEHGETAGKDVGEPPRGEGYAIDAPTHARLDYRGGRTGGLECSAAYFPPERDRANKLTSPVVILVERFGPLVGHRSRHGVRPKTVSAHDRRGRGRGVVAEGCARPDLSDASGAIAGRISAGRRIRRRRADHCQQVLRTLGAAGHRGKQARRGRSSRHRSCRS